MALLRISKVREIAENWAEIFDLKKVVILKKVYRAEAWGMAEWTIKDDDEGKEYHYIRVNMSLHKNNAELVGSIIHEMIHAKQYEKNREVLHDAYFWQMVAFVESLGFYEIACKESDIDKVEKK